MPAPPRLILAPGATSFQNDTAADFHEVAAKVRIVRRLMRDEFHDDAAAVVDGLVADAARMVMDSIVASERRMGRAPS